MIQYMIYVIVLLLIVMIGRDHNATDAIHALESAKRIFGDRGFTFDMIFGRPGNSLDDWRKELEVLLIGDIRNALCKSFFN
jgi:coproporphyrinogen III oxidase-like Fe-S oxidoreductase